MSRTALLAIILISLLVLARAQEGAGQNEYFGPDGRLYSTERSGSDVIRYFLLYRRPISGEDGVYFDGKIRIVTSIVGGGYTIDETEFFLMCLIVDQDLKVIFGQEGNKTEFSVKEDLTKPPRSAIHTYNLWWATCKNKFLKFK